jgi:hypothetical protein
MRIHAKPIMALACGAIILLEILCQPARAQNTLYSGTATLADSFGTSEANPNNEDLTVSYSVALASGVWTYDYTINNPAGDVLLYNNDTPSSTPEEVSSFSVSFDATVPGAYVANSISGGISLADQDNGPDGLSWVFNAVEPGCSSATLSFESDLPPTWGDANASDGNPPSPWASSPDGQPIPVPNVPESTATITLLAGMLLLLPFRAAMLKKA